MLVTYSCQRWLYIPSEMMNEILWEYPILGCGSIVMDDTCTVSLEVPTCGDELSA